MRIVLAHPSFPWQDEALYGAFTDVFRRCAKY
jgi:hypothetical protein